MNVPQDDLRLIALDSEDLAVVSAHLQDAVLKIGDMAYLPREKRFAAIANRFDWFGARSGGDGPPRKASEGSFERRRSAIRFERVLGAQVSGVKLDAKRDVLSLLAVQFEASQEPEGHITLHFSGGGAIRLHVECIEAELRDLGGAWSAKSQPDHGVGEPDNAAEGT
ncbi:MAG: DUF2948 family protein [Pseudomonadota bacterium]